MRRRSPARRAEYDRIIADVARLHHVERALVKAVIRAESGFDPCVVSRAGARGLMQLMPATATIRGVRRVDDPRENIDGGVRHLRKLLDRFHDDNRLAVAAYNAGIAAVARHHGLPPYEETRDYVTRVLAYRRAYLREERALERRRRRRRRSGSRAGGARGSRRARRRAARAP